MKSIAKVWTFPSSSSNKTYQALLYSDGSTSCDCPGWTRRVATDGTRSCKHTRNIDLNRADEEATDFHEYGRNSVAAAAPTAKPTTMPFLQYGHRKLCI